MDYTEFLPTTPPEGLAAYTMKKTGDKAVLAYKAAYERDVLTGVNHKVCEVTCTDCERTWTADRVPVNGRRYDNVSFGFLDSNDYEGACFDGEFSFCPWCGAPAKIMHVSKISSYGSYLDTHHPMSLHKINDTVALVGWWVERRIEKNCAVAVARERCIVYPHEAYILEGRKLTRYTAARKYFNTLSFGKWEKRKRFFDCFGSAEIVYPPSFEALEGTKAENCKLEEYMLSDGRHWPVEYLNTWVKHPNVENLISAGTGKLFADLLNDTTHPRGYYSDYFADHKAMKINWKEVKPAKMLGLTTEEYRRCRDENWGATMLEIYRFCRSQGLTPDTAELMELWGFGVTNVRFAASNGFPIIKTARYLEKQKRGINYYRDYVDMLRQCQPESTELYPPDLTRAHDRLTTEIKLQRDVETDLKFAECFEQYKALGYTDGELEIIIPQHNSELYMEGKTLHHCVGSYGAKHINGEPIFFVRHHRRPERSYYTLNIDMRQEKPKEVQLHGYKNDAKCPVPEKVRAFVDKWEREILTPWHKNQKKKEKNAA